MNPMKARARSVVADFGSNVRVRRLTAGLSHAELAVLARMTDRFIWQIERGKTNPSLESMAFVATALNCTVADLLPTGAVPSVSISAEDMRRAQEALAVLGSIMTSRKLSRRTNGRK
jgi:transcriptional regulator with XRE-family HTH domain